MNEKVYLMIKEAKVFSNAIHNNKNDNVQVITICKNDFKSNEIINIIDINNLIRQILVKRNKISSRNDIDVVIIIINIALKVNDENKARDRKLNKKTTQSLLGTIQKQMNNLCMSRAVFELNMNISARDFQNR